MCVIHSDEKIVYLNPPRLGARERRTHPLADLRVVVDAALELKRVLRERWPADRPVPDDVERVIMFADYAVSRARGGALKGFGERGND